MSDETSTEQNETSAPQIDPAQIQYLEQRLESEQNLPLGAMAGLVASLAGAGIWAGVTVVTDYQIGFMAIGIGFLVGFAVRKLGKGITKAFGVVGAVFSLLGCALGNLLAATAMVANAEGIGLMFVLSQLDLAIAQQLMTAFFGPIDVLFYGIALYYGYRLAFRQLTQAELERMLSGGAAA